MKFLQFQAQVKSQFYPVVALYGDDLYLRSKALKVLISSLDLQFVDLNLSTFNNNDSSVEDVFDACMTLPFADNKRVVVCTDIQPFKQDEVDRALKAYLKNINPTTCLVFDCQKSLSFMDTDGVQKVDCNRLDSLTIAKWIVASAKQRSKLISPTDALTLADYCTRNMSRVEQEVLKLISAVSGEVITLEDIEQNVNKDIEFVVYDLTNALAEANSARANMLLERILSTNEDRRKLVGLIYGNFRRIFFAAITADGTLQSLSAMLGVKEYAVKIAKQLSIRYTKPQLKRILDLIIQAEHSLKVDFANEVQCLQGLVLQILCSA